MPALAGKDGLVVSRLETLDVSYVPDGVGLSVIGKLKTGPNWEIFIGPIVKTWLLLSLESEITQKMMIWYGSTICSSLWM